MRPLMGAVMRVYDQIQFGAVDRSLRRFNRGVIGFNGSANLIGGGQLGIQLLLAR